MPNLKRIRLSGGKWITKKFSERESSPADLARANPDEIWTCSEGRRLLVRDMEQQHILNVMRILEARAEATQLKVKATDVAIADVAAKLFPIYGRLAAELGRRLRNEPAQNTNRNRAIDLED